RQSGLSHRVSQIQLFAQILRQRSAPSALVFLEPLAYHEDYFEAGQLLLNGLCFLHAPCIAQGAAVVQLFLWGHAQG
ncbi:MAG: hypothetical protein ACE5MH_11125, partial [Terriglobia bacterium]